MLGSAQVTILDFTDPREEELAIHFSASNVQLFAPGFNTYSPDYTKEKLTVSLPSNYDINKVTKVIWQKDGTTIQDSKALECVPTNVNPVNKKQTYSVAITGKNADDTEYTLTGSYTMQLVILSNSQVTAVMDAPQGNILDTQSESITLRCRVYDNGTLSSQPYRIVVAKQDGGNTPEDLQSLLGNGYTKLIDTTANGEYIYTIMREAVNKKASYRIIAIRDDKVLGDSFITVYDQLDPVTILFKTPNGTILRNYKGSLTLTATLIQNGEELPMDDYTVSWYKYFDGSLSGAVLSGKTITVSGDGTMFTSLSYLCKIVQSDKVIAQEYITVSNVNDGVAGKTTYLHRAWANSIDGHDDFSLTDSKNRRYLGLYSDTTEESSNDPTKYSWTALFDNIQNGSRNYVLNTAANSSKTGKIYSLSSSVLSFAKDTPCYLSFNWISAGAAETMKLELCVKKKDNPTIEAYPMLKADLAIKNKFEGEYSQPFIWPIEKLDVKTVEDIYISLTVSPAEGVIVSLSSVRLNKGNIPMDWNLAPEDTISQLDAKANNDEVAKALNDINSDLEIQKATLEAKANLQAFKEYQDTVTSFMNKSNDTMKRNQEDVEYALRRAVSLSKDIQSNRILLTALTKYISISEEGLLISSNDGATYSLYNDKGITMFNNGVPVTSIENGILNIHNGVFVDTMRIGNFITFSKSPTINAVVWKGV